MKETKLKERRKKTSLTQVEVAIKAGITPRHYQRLERGDSIPNVKLAKRIAKALGTTVEDLF